MFAYWLRFNTVGLAGVAVQLIVLALLTRGWGLDYLTATFLAVEAAVLHNFAWHEKWTWADRPARGLSGRLGRLARFHLSNGLTSIAGNLALMSLLVGRLHLPVMTANVAAIVACSGANFLLSHLWVFRRNW